MIDKILFGVFISLFIILIVLGGLVIYTIPSEEGLIYMRLFGVTFAFTFGAMILFIIFENRPKRKKSSFEEYLKKEVEKGNIDFSIRVESSRWSSTKFYIHPQNVGGETADFRLYNDTLSRI